MPASYEEALERAKKKLAEQGLDIPETDIIDAIKHGLSQSLPGLGVSALTGYKSDFVPDTGVEKTVSLLTEFAPDIAALVFSGGASGIASIGKTLGKQAIKKALPKLGIKAYRKALKEGLKKAGKSYSLKNLRELPKAALRQEAKMATRTAAKKAMPKLIAKQAAGSGIEGALYGLALEGTKSPLRQYVNTGGVDLETTLKEVGKSMGYGAGIGGGVGLIGGVLKGTLASAGDKIRPVSTGAKPGLINKAHVQANKDYKLVQKGQRKVKSIDKGLRKIKKLEAERFKKEALNKEAFKNESKKMSQKYTTQSKKELSLIREIEALQNKINNPVSRQGEVKIFGVKTREGLAENRDQISGLFSNYKNTKGNLVSVIDNNTKSINNIRKTISDEIGYGVPVSKTVVKERADFIIKLKKEIASSKAKLTKQRVTIRKTLRKELDKRKSLLENAEEPRYVTKSTDPRVIKQQNSMDLSKLSSLKKELERERLGKQVRYTREHNSLQSTHLNKGLKGLSGKIKRLNERKEAKLYEIKDLISKSGLDAEEYLKSVNLTEKLGAKGDNLKALMLRENLKKMGMDDEMIKVLSNKHDSKFLEKTLNINTVLNNIETQTGEEGLYTSFRNVIEAANEGSHINTQYSKGIKSIDDFITANKLNPSRVSRIVQDPTLISGKAETQVVKAISKLTNDFYDEAIKINPNLGYIENYLPGMRKVYTTAGVKSGVKFSKKLGSHKASFEKERLLKEIPELEGLLRETNPVKLLNKYNRALQRMRTEKAFKEFEPTLQKLRLRGYDKKADMLEEWYRTSNGIDKKQFEKINQMVLANENSEYISKIVALNDSVPKPMHQKVLNKINQMMYESWVGTNPRSWAKNIVQPHLVGDVELGFKWINKGSRLLGKHKKLVDKHIKKMVGDRLDLTEMASTVEKPMGVIERVLRAPGRFGLNKIFSKLDRRNRKVSFLGGYLKAKEVGFSGDLLKTLNRSQRNHVMNVLASKGREQASIEFGKIMSDRINYIYNVLDKPMILRGELAQHLPFTTWGRNQWNLYYTDLINNPVSSIATKRAVMPLIQVKAVELLTGLNLRGFVPSESMLGVLSPDIAPGITGIADQLSQGNFGQATKEGGSLLPLIHILQRLSK